MTVRRLLVVGAGGHAAVVLDAALAMGSFDVIGVVDDDVELAGQTHLDCPILATCAAALDGAVEFDSFVVAVGDNVARAEMFRKFQAAGFDAATVVHPASWVSSSASIGVGTMISAGAVVNPLSQIGNNVILNTRTSVDHHCSIADHAHIAPGSTLGGGVTIDEGALVGIGSTVMPLTQVGSWAVVGAGAMVSRAVVSGSRVVGVPARAIERGS